MKQILLIILALTPFAEIKSQNLALLSQVETRSINSSKYHALSIIEANFDTLQLKSNNNILELMLPNNKRIKVMNSGLKLKSNNKYSWFGQVVGENSSSVSFAVVEQSVSGSIFIGNQVFEVFPLGNNRVEIVELDLEKFDSCEGGISVVDTKNTVTHKGLISKDVSSMDVLIVYSNDTLAAVGSAASVESLAQAAIDNMNTSLANSQLLAGVASVNLLAVVGINRNESGNSSTELSWLRSDATVLSLRNQYGADLVSMISATTGCGVGYVMRNPDANFSEHAFQVTKYTCAVGNLTMAHEFGHNLGLEHNPENSSAWPNDGSFDYSYAHYHDGSYRTVMSYSSQCSSACTRRMYYSNPDVTFNSLATGVINERDNARTLEQTTLFAVNFRESVNYIFIDGFE